MNYMTLRKTEADNLLDFVQRFIHEHYGLLWELFDHDPDGWPDNIYSYLKELNVKPVAQDIIVACMSRHFYDGDDWLDAITDKFNTCIGITAETKTNKTKKDTLMETTNTNTQINVADLIKVKMMEKLMDGDTKDLNLGKMSVVQALANGQTVDFGEVMKAKMTEKLLKAVEADEDIPLSKLLMLQAMTSNPNFGINDLVQLKLMEKLLDEPEAKEKTKTK